jgi:hypothetical protein
MNKYFIAALMVFSVGAYSSSSLGAPTLQIGKRVLVTSPLDSKHRRVDLGTVKGIYADGTVAVAILHRVFLGVEEVGVRTEVLRVPFADLEIEVAKYVNKNGEVFRPGYKAVAPLNEQVVARTFHKGTALFEGEDGININNLADRSGRQLDAYHSIATVSEMLLQNGLTVKVGQNVLVTQYSGNVDTGKVHRLFVNGVAQVATVRPVYVLVKQVGVQNMIQDVPAEKLDIEIANWVNKNGDVFEAGDLAVTREYSSGRKITAIFASGTALFENDPTVNIYSWGRGERNLQYATVIRDITRGCAKSLSPRSIN